MAYWSLCDIVLGMDVTDVKGRVEGLADMFSAIAAAVFGFFIIVEGYRLITASDDIDRATHAKRALGCLFMGAVLVVLGKPIAQALYNSVNAIRGDTYSTP
jgi:hypothetical protein